MVTQGNQERLVPGGLILSIEDYTEEPEIPLCLTDSWESDNEGFISDVDSNCSDSPIFGCSDFEEIELPYQQSDEMIQINAVRGIHSNISREHLNIIKHKKKLDPTKRFLG